MAYSYGMRISQADRLELYRRVWSKPMTENAREMGISDVALKKRCKAFGIPTPERGRWAKLRAGKSVPEPAPLEPVTRALAEHVFGYAIRWRATDSVSDEELAAVTGLELLEPESAAVVEGFCSTLVVERQLRNPGSLVAALQQEAEEEKARREPYARSWPTGYQWPYFRDRWSQENRSRFTTAYPFPVTSKMVPRVLRMLDTLDKELWRVEGALRRQTRQPQDPAKKSFMEVAVLSHGFPVVIRELSCGLAVQCLDADDAVLAEVRDGETTAEEQLGGMLLALARSGVRERARLELVERACKREEQRREHEARIARRAEAIEACYQELPSLAQRLDEVEALRALAERLVEASEKRREPALGQLAARARERVDARDPLAEGSDASAVDLARRLQRCETGPCWEFSPCWEGRCWEPDWVRVLKRLQG